MGKSILWGIGAVVVYILARWIYYSVKAVKDPDVQAASRLRMNITAYNKLIALFEAKLQDPFEHTVSRKYFFEQTKKNLKEWKRICEDNANLYKPFYPNGKEVYVKMEDSGKLVKGVITNNKVFSIDWWYYELCFEEAISINNCFPSKRITLSNIDILDIETEKSMGSYNHYHF